ncbi:constitutive coactivator of peroxisome proliferator-activated receptor gamma-like [Schistocerca americana]|uniref:constitutive coactivator of peroxisome proliferator-activated receptor gamma-like n=1 Tax=Schistocerca americana TaxID=7009 RepID=UPI001F4FB966|nr:constitutive coactivator of peroxisome proliferator-activated receptor gamma-like [Schistocerca americana]XP_046986811.1 constitutive coactivator of peroxisome proliferator-activated receptor gamma-like [Schistocerca americana]
MGVHGLRTFVERHCSDVCRWVDMSTLAALYRFENGRKPVIVVDGPSCLKTIYGQLNWTCGGQYKEFREECIKFVKSFEDKDIKLVFFFDGPALNAKRETLSERRRKDKEADRKFFYWLDNNHAQVDQLPNWMKQPIGLHYYARYIFQHFCGCEVYASVNECDEEIVDYARRHSCFGILARDTDFMIHAGIHYYFAVDRIKFPKLFTILYDSKNLADRLRLSEEHLPLFASLMGNDIVPLRKLREYHESVSSRGMYWYKDIALNIADYIRSIPMGDTIYILLRLICSELLHDPSMSDVLAESIWSYLPHPDIPITGNTGSDWERILLTAAEKHRKNEIPGIIFRVLNEVPRDCGARMEDFADTVFPPASIVLQKTKERLKTVLLLECPRTQTSNEMSVNGKDNRNGRQHVTVERFHPFYKGYRLEPWRQSFRCQRRTTNLPYSSELVLDQSTSRGTYHSADNARTRPRMVRKQVRHPGLNALWDSKASDDDTVKKRWGLIAWILSNYMQPEKLKIMPNHLIIPAATLFYLIHEVDELFIMETEVDLFIIMAITINEHDYEYLKGIHVSKPNARGYRLTNIYLKTAMHVFNTIGACGFPVPPQECLPDTYFDGKYFQDLWKKMSLGFDIKSLINHRDDYKAQYLQVKEFLTKQNANLEMSTF